MSDKYEVANTDLPVVMAILDSFKDIAKTLKKKKNKWKKYAKKLQKNEESYLKEIERLKSIMSVSPESIPSKGAKMIMEERQNQISNGYTVQHDSQYSNGELISAAMFCLNPHIEHLYPIGWSVEFKQKVIGAPYYKNLARAGALIAAEIDRRRP